jgi:FtsZ-interacting cell division protein YlmF
MITLPTPHNAFYLKRYEKLIAHCTTNLTISEDYEIHHIVPKCLGGGDDENNLIKLSTRHHFLAHWVLWKAYMTPGLAYAFFMMMVVNKNHSGRTHRINSKTYALLKKHKSQIQTIKNSERWEDSQWAENMSKILSAAASTPKEKERRSKNASKYNAIYKEKKSMEHTARWQNEEWANMVTQRMKDANTKRKIVIVDNIEYSGAQQVAEKFNITKPAVRFRIKSTNFPNWKYKTTV